jgi:hypothetical protein
MRSGPVIRDRGFDENLAGFVNDTRILSARRHQWISVIYALRPNVAVVTDSRQTSCRCNLRPRNHARAERTSDVIYANNVMYGPRRHLWRNNDMHGINVMYGERSSMTEAAGVVPIM